MTQKTWIYDPQSGGTKIPDAIKSRIRQRIFTHAQKYYAGKYNRIDVRFRGKFCYIDAYTEPSVSPDYDTELFAGKSREERIEELRDSPTYLCRLRFFGDEDKWTMAFYSYSQMKYEPCYFDNGTWHGTPEEAFDSSAIYLME
ncbi:MAG: hypothetical protein PHP23_15515 [Desulfobacterales bacterium]|nr:hypothetical protein [Desulfobacterales bacterium]MDD4073750.1 hypothetical protein [Desulfobacterales bacterium]